MQTNPPMNSADASPQGTMQTKTDEGPNHSQMALNIWEVFLQHTIFQTKSGLITCNPIHQANAPQHHGTSWHWSCCSVMAKKVVQESNEHIIPGDVRLTPAQHDSCKNPAIANDKKVFCSVWCNTGCHCDNDHCNSTRSTPILHKRSIVHLS